MTENDVVMMIDTETTNDIDTPIVYDVGYQIFNANGDVLCERSFVNADVFCDKQMMESAFFADKIPNYWKEIKEGSRILKTWFNIKKQIAKDCKEFKVTIACAHNALFDNRALNTTQRYITTSKNRYFLPYGIEWHDTLKMARQVINPLKKYTKFCDTYGYKTKNNQNRLTAEILYRFISGDNDFVESHTGMEDINIEKEIFARCMRSHKKIDKALW